MIDDAARIHCAQWIAAIFFEASKHDQRLGMTDILRIAGGLPRHRVLPVVKKLQAAGMLEKHTDPYSGVGRAPFVQFSVVMEQCGLLEEIATDDAAASRFLFQGSDQPTSSEEVEEQEEGEGTEEDSNTILARVLMEIDQKVSALSPVVIEVPLQYGLVSESLGTIQGTTAQLHRDFIDYCDVSRIISTKADDLKELVATLKEKKPEGVSTETIYNELVIVGQRLEALEGRQKVIEASVERANERYSSLKTEMKNLNSFIEDLRNTVKAYNKRLDRDIKLRQSLIEQHVELVTSINTTTDSYNSLCHLLEVILSESSYKGSSLRIHRLSTITAALPEHAPLLKTVVADGASVDEEEQKEKE